MIPYEVVTPYPAKPAGSSDPPSLLARLLCGEPVDAALCAALPEPWSALAAAIQGRRNGMEAGEILRAELDKLAPEVAREIRAAVMAADPLAAEHPVRRGDPQPVLSRILSAVEGSGEGWSPSGGDGRSPSSCEGAASSNQLAQSKDQQVDLLDTAPHTLRRPLALVDGHGYAATWASIRRTEYAGHDKHGKRVQHRTPVVEESRALVILRDDAALFSDVDLSSAGECQSLAKLGLSVELPVEPPPDKTWSGAGIKRYLAGERPDAANVFRRTQSVVNRFLDFDRSLADQESMSELVACYVVASYLLDALDIVGYLWPNGDRGSGKTTLLHVVAELGYLGQVILAGGTYAALRDLSDYGATLAFDDAENLAGGKKNQDRVDPDKRALLLAGNRRGSYVPLKELTAGKTWRTRYVSTFCPRLFSAIQLPDPVLASRSIVVPLVPTADRSKANVAPVDHTAWPCDRNWLIDDLWALALAHVAELPRHAEAAKRAARLASRALEPWHAILAVAHWLDESGCPGLYERMENLSVAYQTERVELETFNPGLLVVQALLDLATRSLEEPLVVTPSAVAERVKEMTAGDPEEEGEQGIQLSSQKVGRLFRQWRFERLPRVGNNGAHRWSISREHLERLVASMGGRAGNTLQAEPLGAISAISAINAIC